MANKTARKPKDELDIGRAERAARSHSGRDSAEPAAAPMETDTEAGRQHRGPVPRREPAETYMVNSDGETRAGPGDAGRQDAPRVLDNPQDKAPRSNRALVAGIAGGVALMVLILLLTG